MAGHDEEQHEHPARIECLRIDHDFHKREGGKQECPQDVHYEKGYLNRMNIGKNTRMKGEGWVKNTKIDIRLTLNDSRSHKKPQEGLPSALATAVQAAIVVKYWSSFT